VFIREILAMSRVQINVRIDSDLASRLDQKRIELQKEIGKIPSRSEVIRIAIENFLNKQS